MSSLTKADINDLEVNLAWQEIAARVDEMLKKVDAAIENPDSFEHGKAIGERKILRIVKGLPEELRRIVENKGEVATKLR